MLLSVLVCRLCVTKNEKCIQVLMHCNTLLDTPLFAASHTHTHTHTHTYACTHIHTHVHILLCRLKDGLLKQVLHSSYLTTVGKLKVGMKLEAKDCQYPTLMCSYCMCRRLSMGNYSSSLMVGQAAVINCVYFWLHWKPHPRPGLAQETQAGATGIQGCWDK